MFEEVLVCMHCGRPVDGLVYCSDQCESLDATSASVSASSSPYPSPYLQSSMNASGNLADVPALVPSALGLSSTVLRGHRAHPSISSSSNSSVGWSALSDDDLEDETHPRIEGDHPFGTEFSSEQASLKSAHLLRSHSALNYARRPSATNHRSTIPLLHRRESGTSSPSAPVVPLPSSPYYAEDDISDALSSSSSFRSRHDVPRISPSDSASIAESEQEQSTVSFKSRRNRASLPAYFSLLQMAPSSPPSSSVSRRSPSSLQTLTAVSRSLQSSPTTPRVANPIVNLTKVHAESSRSSGVEATTRGRGHRRDCSASSRRSEHPSPPRHTSSSYHHTGMAPQARARLDSLEKVYNWVSSSPVVGISSRGRTHSRRNSSPPPKPKYESHTKDSGVEFALDDESSLSRERRAEDERRGRRRVDELDEAPRHVGQNAPGFGNGRSGLKARERQRGRQSMVIR